RIERDVAQDTDLRHLFLYGADRAAYEVIRIERLAASFIAQFRIRIRKERNAGDGQVGGALGFAHYLIDRQSLHTWHGGDWRPRFVAVHHEQRPDQVVGAKNMLAHHSAGPFGAPVATHAYGEVEGVALYFLRLMISGHKADFALEWAAEFDR